MSARPVKIAGKDAAVAIGFTIFAAALSVAIGFLITLKQFGRDDPAPAAGLVWAVYSGLIFIALSFFAAIYAVEIHHTRAQTRTSVLWRNYGARCLIFICSFVGPMWLLDSHPVRYRHFYESHIVAFVVYGFSILMLLFGLAVRFPVSAGRHIHFGRRADDIDGRAGTS